MQKIIIIGPSGAGKTTLARQLSTRLNIPHFELDSFYHKENWQPADKDIFRKEIYALAEKPQWIFCGNYFSVLGIDFWEKADTVIWCDYPFWLVFMRLVHRTLRRGVTNEVLWNNNKESLRSSLLTKDSVIYWMLSVWRKNKRRHEQIFSEPQKLPGVTLIRLKTPNQVADLVRRLSGEPTGTAER